MQKNETTAAAPAASPGRGVRARPNPCLHKKVYQTRAWNQPTTHRRIAAPLPGFSV